MDLSRNIIKRFVGVTSSEKVTSNDTTTYGTIVSDGDVLYVQLDGSDELTPVSATIDIREGDRVLVLIKNHEATVIGSPTSPTARLEELENLGYTVHEKIIGGELVVMQALIDDLEATDVTINNTLKANTAKIETLTAENVTINGKLESYQADIEELEADNVTINDKLSAAEASISTIEADNITIKDSLEAHDADIVNLQAVDVDIKDTLTAVNADIETLETNKLSAEDADLLYANIDFSNIGQAAMEYFYAESGLIRDVIVSNGTITGDLVGVTISGDLIEGNTIVAEKLVIKGDDGIYYKLNVEAGATTSEEVTEDDLQNGLHGSAIIANTITAEKINVDDLVAFDATIGGFNITEDSIYSGVKESVDNTTRGIYLDNTGQLAFGDANNFIKFYEEDGVYKLAISAQQITFGTKGTNVEEAIDEIKETSIAQVVVEYALSSSTTEEPTSGWSATAPAWESGKYMWQRTVTTYGDGTVETSDATCISGADGSDGESATVLRIDSSRGTVFKNNAISTVLTAVIYHGSNRIEDIDELHSVFGSGAYLQWSWQKIDENTFGTILSTDSMVGNDGFTLTISADEVDEKCTFMCELIS